MTSLAAQSKKLCFLSTLDLTQTMLDLLRGGVHSAMEGTESLPLLREIVA